MSAKSSDCCADCGKSCKVGVSFEVALPGGRVVSWRLCSPCCLAASAAERDS